MQMHTQKDALEKAAPFKSVPRCSMYGIFIYLHLASIYGINVGQYSIIFQSHGACGYVEFLLCMSNLPESSNVQRGNVVRPSSAVIGRTPGCICDWQLGRWAPTSCEWSDMGPLEMAESKWVLGVMGPL